MKQSLVITSVKSRVRFSDSELKRILHKQRWRLWFRHWRNKRKANVPDGYDTLSTYSLEIPLQGVVELGLQNSDGRAVSARLPAATRFFVTTQRQQHGQYTPVFFLSLS